MIMTLLLPFILWYMVANVFAGLIVLGLVLIVSFEEASRFYVRVRSTRAALLVPLGIWLTHVTYGVAFLRGLLLKRDSMILFHKE